MILFNKKFIAILILFSICFSLFLVAGLKTAPVQAESKNAPPPASEKNLPKGPSLWGPLKLALDAGNLVNYAIAFFAGLIIRIEAAILNYILNPDNFPMTQAPIVKTGWNITRTTVNMFFVLVLLVVAFATILRIETYSLKAVLPRLIIVALLINFSLVIAGAILDFANVMTKYFNELMISPSASAGFCIGTDIGCKLINGLKLSKFFQPNQYISEDDLASGFKLATGPFAYFAAILMSTIFLIATVFLFAVLIIMMFIRILYIWVLLILAPAAWFFYIIPAWQNLWYKWWNAFFRWTFFAPIAMFFIFLSITTLDKIGENVQLDKLDASAKNTFTTQNYPIKDPVAAAFQFGVGAALILGSIMVSNSMSITGAGMVTGFGKNLGKKVRTDMTNWLGRKIQATTSRWAGTLGDAMDKSKLFQYRGLRQLSRPFQRYAESGRQYEESLKEQYKNKSVAYLDSLHKKADATHKRAIEAALAEKGMLDAVLKNPDDKKKAVERAFNGGNKGLASAIIKFDPRVAKELSETILKGVMGESVKNVEDVLKALKPDDWVKMNNDSFADLSKKLLKTSRPSHLSKIGEQADFKKIDLIQKAINESNENEIPEGVKKYLNSQAGQAFYQPTYNKKK